MSVVMVAAGLVIARRVAEDAQGELQGAVASTVSLTAIIGPVVMTQIFARFSDDEGLFFPGAPYILSIALLLVGIGLLWRTLARDGRYASRTTDQARGAPV